MLWALLFFSQVHVPPFRGTFRAGTPHWYPLIHFTPLPLSASLHTCRDLPGVSPWILRMIQFGYKLQFARNPARLLSCNRKSLPLKGAIEVSSSDLHHGFFSRYFLVLKKDGGLHPAQAELPHLQREIQDADAQEHSFPGLRGELVRHGRPEGCLLPHPGGSEAQEVPQVRLQGKSLPVQGSSLWASSGPKNFHQVYGYTEAPGHPNPLPGWLAYLIQLHRAGISSQGLSPSPTSVF